MSLSTPKLNSVLKFIDFSCLKISSIEIPFKYNLPVHILSIYITLTYVVKKIADDPTKWIEADAKTARHSDRGPSNTSFLYLLFLFNFKTRTGI